jgi:hypothetical protein
MKARAVVVSAFVSVMLSSPVLADTWSEADALFAVRDSGRDKIAAARAKYSEILETASTKADKIRATSQLARLAVYEGEMTLPKDDVEGRKAIFSSCFCAKPSVNSTPTPRPNCEAPGFMEKISPAAIGEEHPAYYYFKSICEGYWGEVAGPMEKLAYSQWLKADLAKGLTLDTRFEGGGILRVSSGVYSNPKAAPVQMYDPDRALLWANQAVASQAYPGDPSDGAQYYENLEVRVKVLMQLASDRPNSEFKQQAMNAATSMLSEMDERFALDDLPAGRAPEFRYTYLRTKGFYKDLTGTDWQGY